MEVRATVRTPAPLNLPGDLDSTTVPVTPAPAGIATSPLTATGRASVPVKVSPSFAVLVSMVLPMRTTMCVPAGTTNGGGGGGGGGVASAFLTGAGCCTGAACWEGAADGLLWADEVSFVAAVGGFWLGLLQASIPATKIKLSTSADIRERMFFSFRLTPDRNASSQLLRESITILPPAGQIKTSVLRTFFPRQERSPRL